MTVLIVDDDARIAESLAADLRRDGHATSVARNYEQAMKHAGAEPPEIAVIDSWSSEGRGVGLLEDLKERHPSTRAVVITGFASIANAVHAVRLGAAAAAAAAGAARLSSLAVNEWEHIHRVLGECEGNISEAARALGIHRRTLQRKLQKAPGAEY